MLSDKIENEGHFDQGNFDQGCQNWGHYDWGGILTGGILTGYHLIDKYFLNQTKCATNLLKTKLSLIIVYLE